MGLSFGEIRFSEKRSICRRDGQLRHSSIAVRRFGHSVAAAGAAGAGFGRLAHSTTATRLRKRSARPRSYWGPSPIDQHANRGDRLVARTHSGSPGPCAYSRSRYGAGGVRNVPGRPLPRSPSRQVQPLGATLRAARARARRSARSGWAPQYDSIASRGVGGTNGRLSARDRSALVLCNRHRFVELRYRAQRRRYIGDKGHEVRPSLMRKAAIDCSLFPDASDFVRCWRRWGRRDWRRPNYACACERPLLERPTNVAPRRTSTLMICLSRDKRNEGAETTTTWR